MPAETGIPISLSKHKENIQGLADGALGTAAPEQSEDTKLQETALRHPRPLHINMIFLCADRYFCSQVNETRQE
jgi:hypothetical protein